MSITQTFLRHLHPSPIFHILVTFTLVVPLTAQPVQEPPAGFSRTSLAPYGLLIANAGQFPPETRFHAYSQRLQAELSAGRILLTQDQDQVEMLFPGANANALPEPLGPLPTRVNYILGDAKPLQDVPAYSAALYRDLYPGIDLRFTAEGGQFKTDFIVQPGADHRRLQVRYRGASSLTVEDNGDLAIAAANGVFREHAPVVYQDLPAGRHYLQASYFIQGDDSARFLVEDYDRRYPLVIDPALSYSTYFGGTRADYGASIAVDTAGSMYVAGYTASTNIPTLGSIQNFGGNVDAFVFKFNSTGTTLLYATFIGGSGDDRATAVAVDAAGSAYLCGGTYSTNFPTANATPIQPARGGNRDAFVLKLNAAGNALVYSSYIGGSGNDVLNACVLDSYNQLYAVGETSSTNLPTKFPFQASNGGGLDAFLIKVSLNNSLSFATYFGGSGDDSGRGIGLHPTQLTPYVTGSTTSTNLPLKNPAQPATGGGQDAFVARFNSDANNLVYSTYLGGSGGTSILPEQGLAITVDIFGNAYTAGVTSSTNFPTLAPYQATNRGGLDAFFAKHDNGGLRVFSSYFGGTGADIATAIAVDINRQVFLAGYSSSVNLPTYLPVQAANAGSSDAFVAQLNVNGSALIFSTYLGGTGSDQAAGIAINAAGEMFLTGVTASSNFPTQSAYRFTNAGVQDIFLTKITAAPVPPSAPVFASLIPNSGSGTSATFALRYTDANGANNFESVQFLINGSFSGVNACQVAYVHSTGLVYLLNNTGTSWLGGYAPGTLNTLSNSQCSLPLASMTVSAIGSDLTVNIPLSFVPTTFTGTKTIYALALDKGGLRSDWNIRGSWIFP
ncbi:MAG: SBBP repeat-containing protein [Bryobacterales bacterium]|nr:SBBP repeat-containing protein [Bryobacterales bacterium]